MHNLDEVCSNFIMNKIYVEQQENCGDFSPPTLPFSIRPEKYDMIKDLEKVFSNGVMNIVLAEEPLSMPTWK